MVSLGRKITLEPSLILWLSVLWFCREDLVLPFLLAVAVHELGHISLLLLLHRPPKSIILGVSGAQLETPALSYLQTCLAAAAGPVASLLLALCAPLWPALALYSLILGLFNLLPVPGLDGGVMLSSLLLWALPESAARRIAGYLGLLTALGLWGGALYLSGPGGFGLWPLMLAGIFLYKALSLSL